MTRPTLTNRDQLTFTKEPLKRLEFKPEPPGIESVLGLLAGKSRKVASIEEIREATEEGWAKDR